MLYEDWPRGRIVFDRSRDVFIIYADDAASPNCRDNAGLRHRRQFRNDRHALAFERRASGKVAVWWLTR
jgi:hypothetical protein